MQSMGNISKLTQLFHYWVFGFYSNESHSLIIIESLCVRGCIIWNRVVSWDTYIGQQRNESRNHSSCGQYRYSKLWCLHLQFEWLWYVSSDYLGHFWFWPTWTTIHLHVIDLTRLYYTPKGLTWMLLFKGFWQLLYDCQLLIIFCLCKIN